MGFLVPIGGGAIGPVVINKLLMLAGGGAGRRVVVLPMAAGRDHLASGERYADLFRRQGAANVQVLDVANRQQATEASNVGAVAAADIVFFGGGDQTRLTAAIAGSPMETVLRRRLYEDLVLAGTSAGAAVMGEIMPASGTGWGSVLRGEAASGAVLDESREPLVLVDGLGFLPGVAVDQHFLARGRFGRLLYTISKYRRQSFLGLGIDEGTALFIDFPSLVGEVTGDGAVMLFRASRDGYDNLPEVGIGSPLATFGMTVDVLSPGCAVDVGRGLPIAPPAAAREAAVSADA